MVNYPFRLRAHCEPANLPLLPWQICGFVTLYLTLVEVVHLGLGHRELLGPQEVQQATAVPAAKGTSWELEQAISEHLKAAAAAGRQGLQAFPSLPHNSRRDAEAALDLLGSLSDSKKLQTLTIELKQPPLPFTIRELARALPTKVWMGISGDLSRAYSTAMAVASAPLDEVHMVQADPPLLQLPRQWSPDAPGAAVAAAGGAAEGSAGAAAAAAAAAAQQPPGPPPAERLAWAERQLQLLPLQDRRILAPLVQVGAWGSVKGCKPCFFPTTCIFSLLAGSLQPLPCPWLHTQVLLNAPRWQPGLVAWVVKQVGPCGLCAWHVGKEHAWSAPTSILLPHACPAGPLHGLDGDLKDARTQGAHLRVVGAHAQRMLRAWDSAWDLFHGLDKTAEAQSIWYEIILVQA